MSLGLIVAWASEMETTQSHKSWTVRSDKSQHGVAMSIPTTLLKSFTTWGCTTMKRLLSWRTTLMASLLAQDWARIWPIPILY